MSVVCPNCASHDALSLSLIHREGASHAASSRAAPPSKRNVSVWLVLAVACSAFLVLSIRHFNAASVMYAGGSLLGVWMARANRAFNARRFPELYRRWQVSFRCTACGSVFPAS